MIVPEFSTCGSITPSVRMPTYTSCHVPAALHDAGDVRVRWRGVSRMSPPWVVTFRPPVRLGRLEGEEAYEMKHAGSAFLSLFHVMF
jgi:hypothetical protein